MIIDILLASPKQRIVIQKQFHQNEVDESNLQTTDEYWRTQDGKQTADMHSSTK